MDDEQRIIDAFNKCSPSSRAHVLLDLDRTYVYFKSSDMSLDVTTDSTNTEFVGKILNTEKFYTSVLKNGQSIVPTQ
jgi:hypothetical protein